MKSVVVVAAFLIVGAAHGQERRSAGEDWTHVRSVSDLQGGALDFVVVPEERQRERPYYEAVGTAVCGERKACLVHFWTDRAVVPTTAVMSGPALSAMTATYERYPTYPS